MKTTSWYWILFVIFMLICLIWRYCVDDDDQLKCIVSKVDGNIYCVRERAKLELAADLLAETAGRCKLLVKYLNDKYPDDDKVKRLTNKFDPEVLCETLPTSTYTAYSENKGEKIAFCLNKKKNGTQLIDINTLTFVAIHELAHIMTISEGHNQIFWQNFKFLLVNAYEANLCVPVDYKNEPVEFCSMKITDNPYYDM